MHFDISLPWQWDFHLCRQVKVSSVREGQNHFFLTQPLTSTSHHWSDNSAALMFTLKSSRRQTDTVQVLVHSIRVQYSFLDLRPLNTELMESKLAQNCARHNIASGFVHSRGRNWEKSFLPAARNNNLPLPLARAKVDRSQSVFYFVPQEISQSSRLD